MKDCHEKQFIMKQIYSEIDGLSSNMIDMKSKMKMEVKPKKQEKSKLGHLKGLHYSFCENRLYRKLYLSVVRPILLKLRAVKNYCLKR